MTKELTPTKTQTEILNKMALSHGRINMLYHKPLVMWHDEDDALHTFFTSVRTVNAMLRQGWISRRINGQGQFGIIRITDEGRAALERNRA